MEVQHRLKAYARLVDERLAGVLPPEDKPPRELHAAMRYSCLAPGKRLRPALCMAAAEAVGAAPESVLDAACALEMVHTFSLVHDDLPALDDDDLRRGRPTCHKAFGEAVAILAGDTLLVLALDVLAHAPGEPARVLRSIRALTRATGSDGLAAGEAMDVLSEGRPVDAEGLDFIHSHKTGALIAASLEIGAILGGGDDRAVASLRAFGESIGLAFQIADDLLNVTATPEQLGKSAGSDRERQKATYPAIHGLEASREAAHRAAEQGIARLDGVAANRPFLEGLARFAVERLH